MKKHKLTFSKGIDKIYVPFMLTDLEPWQYQVYAQINKVRKNCIFRKSATIGFEITENGASIIVRK